MSSCYGTLRSTLAVLLAVTTAFPQTPNPAAAQTAPTENVIRINVNLVQVDAVVTDSKGKPVTDLKAEDFVILQDGKPQNITNFSYLTTHTDTAAPGRAAQPPAPRAADKRVPAVPTAAIKPRDVKRTMALIVDDLGLSFESISRVRDSLKKFVDQQMRPGDLVAIIRTGAGMGALQEFTTDKRMLYAAIERVKFNSFGRVGVSSFAPIEPEPGTKSREADISREEIFAAGSLGAVRYVVDGLRDLPGRKSALLFSENVRLFNADGMGQRVLDSVRHLIDAANRASVVLYTIDPRGLQYYGPTAADDTSGMNARQLANIGAQREREVFRSQEGLVMLADETGGLFLHDTNDLDGAVRKVLADSEGYYLIGYHPEASTFDSKTGLPRFHKVSVKVKRAGLQVRSRSGFFGTSDGLRQVLPHTRDAQIAHALASPFGSSGIHLRLTPLFTTVPKVGSSLNTMIFIDGKDLKFTDEPEGWHKTVIDVVATTVGDNGQALDRTSKVYTLRSRGKSYENILKFGLLYSVSHLVKKPGAYQMRVAVRDESSEQVGSASQFIEVPDVSKGRLTLSSIVLQQLAKKGAAAPQQTSPETPPEGQIPDENPRTSAALRSFEQGASLLYGYQVINPQSDSNHQPVLETQTRIFRDGQEIYASKPEPLHVMQQLDPKLVISAGSMKLSDQIERGDYVLQVIVTDKLAKEKYQVASQFMDFEVR